MKLPKARQLPSGSWFVRVQVDGQTISITRPTKKEAEQEAMALKSGAKKHKQSGFCTLNDAIDRYIDARQTASPETIRGYRKIQANRFQQAMTMDIYKITQNRWQQLVNQEALQISPKYLKNSWMFIAAVIAEETGERIHVNLPTVVPPDLNFLEPDEIPKFLDAIRGDKFEIEILLALHSLRKSEILDMTWNDIDLNRGLIHVRGSAVFNEHGKLVHKESNKNETSSRTIPIMIPRLTELVKSVDKSSAYIHVGDPNLIYRHTVAACKKANVTICSLHDLRRTFASLCYHLKVSEMTCQRLGGWKDFMTMRKVYTKLSQRDHDDEVKRIMSFFSEGNCNENCNETKNSL